MNAHSRIKLVHQHVTPAVSPEEKDPRFLTIKDVIARTTLSRATIFNMVKVGEFPRPIRITKNRTAYLEADVIAWQNAVIAREKAAQERREAYLG